MIELLGLLLATLADALRSRQRRECLDHILPLSEQHVRAVLADFASYYNQDRHHRSLGLETPVPSQRPDDAKLAGPRRLAPRL